MNQNKLIAKITKKGHSNIYIYIYIYIYVKKKKKDDYIFQSK